MSKLLALHREIRAMQRWFARVEEPYPKDSVKRFTEWLVETFPDVADRAGALMLMRDAGINWSLFFHDELDRAWYDECEEALAHAMGGRMGEKHSGRNKSAFPLEAT